MKWAFERKLLTEIEDTLPKGARRLYGALRKTVWMLVSNTAANPSASLFHTSYQPVQLKVSLDRLGIQYYPKYDGQLPTDDRASLDITTERVPGSKTQWVFRASVSGSSWRHSPRYAQQAARTLKKCGDLGVAAVDMLEGRWTTANIEHVRARIKRYGGLMLPPTPYDYLEQRGVFDE